MTSRDVTWADVVGEADRTRDLVVPKHVRYQGYATPRRFVLGSHMLPDLACSRWPTPLL